MRRRMRPRDFVRACWVVHVGPFGVRRPFGALAGA
jgi:hypothetical protein